MIELPPDTISYYREPRTTLRMAEHVIGRLTAVGVEVPSGSRIDSIRRAHFGVDGAPRQALSVADPEYPVVLEAIRDLYLLRHIVDELLGSAVAPQLRIRLKALVRDEALPQADTADTTGRDAQAELYVAAVCARAGLRSRIGEPDVVCAVDGTDYGIAVKRVKSLGQLMRRVNGAGAQLRMSGLPGCVFVDASRALNPENRHALTAAGDDEYFPSVLGELRGFVERHVDAMYRSTRGTGVQGVVVLDHRVRNHPEHGWGMDTFSCYRALPLPADALPEDAARQAQFGRFMRAYANAISS